LPATVKAHPHNLERVLTALEKRGVTIEEDGREAEALSTTSRLLRNDETHVSIHVAWRPCLLLETVGNPGFEVDPRGHAVRAFNLPRQSARQAVQER
jgi:hypothetical protein